MREIFSIKKTSLIILTVHLIETESVKLDNKIYIYGIYSIITFQFTQTRSRTG